MTTLIKAAPYCLRDADWVDFDFIYEVARSTMRQYVTEIWGWDEAFQSKQFRDNFHPGEWQVLVVDNKMAGCVNVRYRDTEIFLANIYILPEFQRRGIGSSIIGGLQQTGVETGRPVRLHVLTSNRDAYRLYLRLGFRVVESTSEKRLMST